MTSPIRIWAALPLSLLWMFLSDGCSRGESDPGRSAPEGRADVQPAPSRPKPSYDPREAAKRAAILRASAQAVEEAPPVPLSDADKELSKRIQEALDAESKERVLALVPEVKAAKPHSEVRRHLIRALGWFESDSLEALLEFVNDDDEPTATDARELVAPAIDTIDDEGEKSAAIVKALAALTDEGTLDEVAAMIPSLDDRLALSTILSVLDGQNKAATAKVRETYEFVTGESFTGRESVENRLKQSDTEK